MRRGRIGTALLALLVTAGALTACTPEPIPTAAPAHPPAADENLTDALTSLPTATLQPTQPMRLSAGLLPPTNRWFSGLVFGARPQPVYPLPLAYSPTMSGFSVALPKVTATAGTIAGPAGVGLGVDLGASRFRVTRYDDLTVTVTYYAGSSPVANVTLAQGWPYVAVTARRALSMALSAAAHPVRKGLWRTMVGGVRYDVAFGGPAPHGRLHLAPGKQALVFAVPDGVPEAALVAGARGAVTGGTVSSVATTRDEETRLRYRTQGGSPTLLALPPGTASRSGDCSSGTVLGVGGRMRLCAGTAIATSVPRLAASDRLDLSSATATDEARLTTQLAKDIRATPAEPADSYGGGKWLYRLANLLQLADQLRARSPAAAARAKLDAALREWTQAGGCLTRTSHCFVYDPVLHSVVGHEASFGSDQVNDHHFHYGYFLYAAAVAVQDRPMLRTEIAPVMNLLAADIASPPGSSRLPALRVFDPYAGHSWASGFAPFADGNNQESSSEAVSAWNGLALWASATGNRRLEQQATWLLSTEARAAVADWLHPDLSPFPGFQHPFVSLNWSGKRDSATWFSADPAAKLAIQLIPMSPVAGYLRTSRSSIEANLSDGRSAGTGLFPDYLLMYEALTGEARADLARRADAVPDARIDSADSRSYLLAWILSR